MIPEGIRPYRTITHESDENHPRSARHSVVTSGDEYRSVMSNTNIQTTPGLWQAFTKDFIEYRFDDPTSPSDGAGKFEIHDVSFLEGSQGADAILGLLCQTLNNAGFSDESVVDLATPRTIEGYMEKYGLDELAGKLIEDYIAVTSNVEASDDEVDSALLTFQADLWLHAHHENRRVLNLLQEVTSDVLSQGPDLPRGRQHLGNHSIAINMLSVHGTMDPFINEQEDEFLEHLKPAVITGRKKLGEIDLTTASRGEIGAVLIDLQGREGTRRRFLSTIFTTLSEEAEKIAQGLLSANRAEDSEFFMYVSVGYGAAARKTTQFEGTEEREVI